MTVSATAAAAIVVVMMMVVIATLVIATLVVAATSAATAASASHVLDEVLNLLLGLLGNFRNIIKNSLFQARSDPFRI